MPLKGSLIRRLYPAPEMRTSCDVDFFYDTSEKKKVYQALIDLGFKKGEENQNHCEWVNGVVAIESHHSLVSEGSDFDEYYKDVWSRLVCVDKSEYNFTKEDLFIYAIIHSAKHFASAGFGVRTVLDFYFFNRQKDLNREYLSKELEKLGLKEYEKILRLLADYWFGDGDANDDILLVGDYILKSGVYGNTDNFAIFKGGESDLKSSKKKFWIRTIFPSYKTMKGKYKILKKLPFLLPLVWIYRWFEVLFSRPKNIKSTITDSKNLNQDRIDFTNEVMKITKIKKSIL